VRHSGLSREALTVGVPNFSHAIERQACNAVELILDTALGERATALDIQHVEVSTLPESPQAAGYIKLYELPSYIEWRKRKSRDAWRSLERTRAGKVRS
jgi:hypothetical protein